MAAHKDDLLVNIADSPSGSEKAGAALGGAHSGAGSGGAVQRAKDWLNRRPRNKAIAGGALASVLLLPAIVAPAVVMSQKQTTARRMRVPDWGAYSGAGSKYAYGNPLVSTAGRGGVRPGGGKLGSGVGFAECARRVPARHARTAEGARRSTHGVPMHAAARPRRRPTPFDPSLPFHKNRSAAPPPVPRATPTTALSPASPAAPSCPRA